jgi:K+-transporting ATPase ATPase C chain
MWMQLRTAALMLLWMTLLTGVGYPLAVTGIAQAVFPHQANGSLIEADNKLAGSALIGQPFASPKYFWGRPSATSPGPYNGAASSGSNLGPTNPDYLKSLEERVAALKAAHPDQPGVVPADLVTTSGSGLDPHISPAAAEYQIQRVANARGLSADLVRELVARHTEGRTLGLFGERRVNVLQLNLALDRAVATRSASFEVAPLPATTGLAPVEHSLAGYLRRAKRPPTATGASFARPSRDE